MFTLRIACSLFLLILCLLPGCTKHESDNTLHFLMWKPHQPKPLEDAIARFEAQTGIRVDRHIGSENASEYYRELTTKLRNHDPDLDVFFLDVIWPPEFTARGWLADLSERLPESARAGFFPGPLKADTIDGALRAVPFNIDVGLLFYRKDLLEQYHFSPPKSWSELLAQSDAILAGEGKTHPDLIGYAGQFDQYEGLVCNLLEFVESGGGSLLDAGGRPALASPEVIAAVRFIRDELLHNAAHPRRASDYLLTAKEQESRDIFARGDAVFLRNWPETWKILNNPERSSVAGRVGMVPLPAFEGGQHAGTLGGWQFGIASYSPRQALAWKFILFMTGHETQRQLAIDQAQTMARMTIYDDPALLKVLPFFGRPGPWGAPLRDAAMHAVPRPRLVRYNAVSERIQRCVYEAIRTADSDIPALMAGCDKAVAEEMRRGGEPVPG
jgi:ABC-type glycerol-3-phosphate transport system substrate-binding protein